MATQTYYSLALLFLVTTHNIVINTANPTSESKCDCFHSSFTRQIFPPDFVFGAASSAYQFEGAYKENGKGLSLWDDFTHNYPGKIKDHSNGDIAIDSYHLYKEDVKIARNLGLDAYRISISWPRILPGGNIEAGVSQEGIDYYNNLINQLLANGIEPFVTLLHLDIPQALQVAYGGFLDSQIVTNQSTSTPVLKTLIQRSPSPSQRRRSAANLHSPAPPQVEGLPHGAQTTSDIPFHLSKHLRKAMDLTAPTIESLLRQLKPHLLGCPPWSSKRYSLAKPGMSAMVVETQAPFFDSFQVWYDYVLDVLYGA